MRELFVYYRIRPGAHDAAHSAVAAMQRDLRATHRGLEARLLKRSDAGTGDETWMEIYASTRGADALAIDASLEREIDKRSATLAAFIDGPRHTERFEAAETS